MPQKTDAELTTEAQVIRDETTELANTKTRVYDILKNIIDSKPNNSVGAGAWGTITGTLADQTDLDSALDAIASSISNHMADTTDAHAGTAISNTAAGGISSTTVQAAINELDTEKLSITNRVLGLSFSDETTPITATAGKLTFHFPYTTTIQEIWVELKTAQASGNIFTVDVHVNGTTILSTKVTIDNTEETSLTATTPPVISSASITKGDKVVIDVDQVGNGTAIGGKIWFRG